MGERAPRRLPRLAFVYSGLNTEDPPLLLAEAAEGVASLLWILLDAQEVPRAAQRMLRGLGEIVDVTALQPDDAAAVIRDHAPDGILCFNDSNLVWAAEIAQQLGLRYFSPETAVRLTDKLAQREALRDHGQPTPEFWDADRLDAVTANSLADTTDFPLVLKPRRGRSSQDVEGIESREQLLAALASAEPGRMLVERYIPDPSITLSDTGSAPYVSVELLVSDGRLSVLGVVGKPPLAPPFRETGSVFPSDLPRERQEQAIAAALAATQALGVENGPLHVEVKFTDAGPVVIEANGVMGGGAIRDLLMRGLGLDVVQLTMRIAAGEHIELDESIRPTGVGFFFELQPDVNVRRIIAVDGLEGVSSIPGVERVIPGLRAGDEFTWRTGTHSFIAAIFGKAPDHARANAIRKAFYDQVVVTATS